MTFTQRLYDSDASATLVSKSTGREVWRVSSGGEQRTLVVSRKSVEILDKAVVVYAAALKRLADR